MPDASTALTSMGANPGTVKCFSPEQAKEHPIDQRSDIYTLDVLLARDPDDPVSAAADVISIVQAMERNWLRFGEIDRLTDDGRARYHVNPGKPTVFATEGTWTYDNGDARARNVKRRFQRR